MSGRDDVSNEYLLHSLAQGEVSPEVAAATSLTVEVRQLRAERTTPAPSSGAGLDLDASHVRTDPACTFHDGTTPPASRGKRCPACMRLDLDAMARRYSTATDDEVIYEMYPALEAEVGRLTEDLDAAGGRFATNAMAQAKAAGVLVDHPGAGVSGGTVLQGDAEITRLRSVLVEEIERAEAAEAEVGTLRARLAAVEALADQWADRKRSDGMSGNAWIGLTLSGVAADLRAALATTGEGQ